MEKVSQLISLLKEQWFLALGLLILILLVLSLVALLVYEGFTLIAQIQETHLIQTIHPLKIDKHTSPLSTKSIASWHIFDQGQTAREISQTWFLHGIILGVSSQTNKAVIASAPGDEAIYQSGDTLADGSIISTIYSDRVVLLRQGVQSSLYFPKNETTASASSPDSIEQIYKDEPGMVD